MASEQHECVVCFANLLTDFIHKLDETHQYWRASAPSFTVDELQRKSHLNMALIFRDQTFESRNAIRKLALRAVTSITPPPNQSAKQFVASVMDNVESAWHLCRFMHCISPDDKSNDSESEILENGLRFQFPKLRNELWESSRHLNHIIYLATPDTADSNSADGDHDASEPHENIAQPSRKPRRRGRKKAEPDTVKREDKLVAKWAKARDAGVYKPIFAKEQKMELVDFDQLLGRVRKRKKNAE